MNKNYFVRCDVCETWHRVRIQAGYLNDYAVRFYCGECNSRICGNVHLDPKDATVEYRLAKGALASIGEAMPEECYLVECSGELLTKKMSYQRLDNLSSLVSTNPFFATIGMIDPESFSCHIASIDSGINHYDVVWEHVYRALRLYNQGSGHLADEQIMHCEKLLKEEQYEGMSLADRVRRLSWNGMPIFSTDEAVKRALKAERLIKQMDLSAITELVNYYNLNGEDLNTLLGKILHTADSFAKCFTFLIPAFTYQALNRQYDLNIYGTNLCTIEDISNIYCLGYELLGQLVPLLIGLDNIHRSGAFDNMPNNTAGLPRDYERLKTTAKGSLLKLSIPGEFVSLINKCWSRDLRNAFSHNGYRADSKDQLIQIVETDGSIDNTKSLWLIDAMCQCIDMLRNIFVCRDIILVLMNLAEHEIELDKHN